MEDDLLTSRLCDYAYALSGRFNQFYESCPVLASAPAQRASRAKLCAVTANTLRLVLGILGIPVLERL